MVPITNKHLGVWRETESSNAFWGVEEDPSSPMPQIATKVAGNVIQDEDTDVSEEMT